MSQGVARALHTVLKPAKHFCGDKERKGSITRAGNRRVRRLLTESSWHCRHGYNVSKALKKRREGQPQWAINIADQAGVRLRRRYYRLISQGKIPCKAVVAIASELAGFIWFILTDTGTKGKHV